MASMTSLGEGKTRTSVYLIIVVGLCCFFYVLGAWQKSGFGKGDTIALQVTTQRECTSSPNLNFESHHSGSGILSDLGDSEEKTFVPCDKRYTDYTPCQDQMRAMTFPRESMIYRERHCPPDQEKLYCLIPAPKGYISPFPWPKSRDYVPYANVPYKNLTIEKAVQNWVQYEGDVFRFPGGGTQFPEGADKYIDQLASVIPIDNGTIRTALDTGCGVASWGAYLLEKNVLAMSFAPRDSHEAQVQFALERGVPAVIGVLGSIKLPYPSRAFDMAHCSRCLIPWGANDGIYLKEVDRVLRPGGYWVLSGPPINWKSYYQAWNRSKEDLVAEQRKIEEIAELLCWEKVSEMAEFAIWRKRVNAESCTGRKKDVRVNICESTNPDDVWYKKMEPCINPYSEVGNPDEVAGGELEPFPHRLFAIPPRIYSGTVPGLTVKTYQEDNKQWQKHVEAYKKINKLLDTGRYRNIMDMNAGLGSFAAAIESPKLWVMNVVPTIAEISTLGVIYERGLIGIYHDWCEAFSTYPRTYDLIHAGGIFSLYRNKCRRVLCKSIRTGEATAACDEMGIRTNPCLASLLLFLLFVFFTAASSIDSDLGTSRVVFQTNYGDIEFGFLPYVAPKTVEHIFKLVRLGCYNTNHFFRVDKGFVAQVADVIGGRTAPMNAEQRLEAEKTVVGEFSHIKHVRGILSMGRYSDPDSASSSFSILLGDAPHLDGKYAIFGRMTKGDKTLRRLEELPTRQEGIFVMPTERISILSTYYYDTKEENCERENEILKRKLSESFIEVERQRMKCLP